MESQARLDERVKRVAGAIASEAPFPIGEIALEYMAKAAIAASDATLEVTQQMVEAFEYHLVERHNYCKDLSDCCIIGGMNAALAALRGEQNDA